MSRAITLLPALWPGTVAARLIGTGVVVGLAAGAAWVAGKALSDGASRDSADNPRLINWEWARSIASRAARQGETVPWTDSRQREATQHEYASLVDQSAELVGQYTGLRLPAALTQVHVFDRAEWVDANLAQFRLMFGPLDDAYAAAIARTPRAGGPVGVLGQAVLSGQVGILLGYLARRVLGQYDLSLLGREPVTAGRLYFVVPNLLAFERQYRLPAAEFRSWIALHEVTHAFELEAQPWVRRYMNDLLTSYLRTLSEDLFGNQSRTVLGTWAGRIKDNLFESHHVLELMMSREQRDIFRRLQALMAVMEGYSNHVMNEVGARRLHSHHLLKQTFESRLRHRSAAEQLFIKLTGLDIKLEQYALGERFCEQVVTARGIDFLNRVWQAPECLPTLAEIREPARWITRQARALVPKL
jgi:coenzyme F420 biosynthesis associated uncharacterized protein